MGIRQRIGTSITVATPQFTGPVHVRTDGRADGPVLLMIHGFGGSMHWHDLVVPRLADTFSIVRLDLLGHGATGGPAVDAPAQAAVVEAVLAELDIDNVTALGHSFGADVAVELAQRSRRVTRLIIVTQAPDYSDATLPRGSRVMTVPVVNAVLQRSAHRLGVIVNETIELVRRRRGGHELLAQAMADLRALDTAMFRVVLVDRRKRMARRPLDAQVREAGKPTLVVLGERDHFYGARSADRYRAAGARVQVLPESGHSPLVEAPADMATIIRNFASE